MTIAERIRTRREALNWTTTQLAAAIPVSTSTITNIETGRRAPSPKLAMKLNQVLGIRITLTELASMEVENQAKPQRQPELA